jgi:predicted ATP-dependent endonuclease of OLD family
VYSFGILQELNQLADFNLFIGKNGTGKTNVFRVLSDISFEFVKTEDYDAYIIYSQLAGMKNLKYKNNYFSYKPSLSIELLNNLPNRQSQFSNINGLIQIDYEEITHSEQKIPDYKRLIFREDFINDNFRSDYDFKQFQYAEGDVSVLSRNIINIQLPRSESEYYKDRTLILGDEGSHYLFLHNFALYYIFGLHYKFIDRGMFLQGNLIPGGKVEKDSKSLPSGVLNCSKIIIKYLNAANNASILLLDEPELHLEPRVIRRFFQFIIWLETQNKDSKTSQENAIYSKIQNCFFEFQIEAKKNNPDIKPFPEKIFPRSRQIFIASHSPVLINEFLNLNSVTKIFEFKHELFEFKRYSIPDEVETLQDLFSEIREIKITEDTFNIFDDLGCKGSDILQANGIIWVEGPSDAIYIKKWLTMYSIENLSINFTQGKHFEFVMFAGTLLDSISLIMEGEDAENEFKKITSMLTLSRNSFIIIDSDLVQNADKKIYDKSKFFESKKYIKNQIHEITNRSNRKIGLWYKEGNSQIRTIEDYLDQASIDLKKKSWSKKVAAIKITSSWNVEKKLADFPNELYNEIQFLYSMIESWNLD